MTSNLTQYSLQRSALKLEIEAADKLLDAAHTKGSVADVAHLETHTHNLVRQYHEATANLFRALRKQMGAQ